jgi:hypothetical protein
MVVGRVNVRKAEHRQGLMEEYRRGEEQKG